jgi:hypothetical protein
MQSARLAQKAGFDNALLLRQNHGEKGADAALGSLAVLDGPNL